MELSPSWVAANCAATQELPSILWIPKFQYHVRKSLPWVPILSHINQSTRSHHLKIHFNFLHLPTSWSSQWSLLSFSSVRATWPVHLTLLDLIILIILGEEYKLRSSSNLLSLHPSLVQIFSTPSSQTPSVYIPPLMSETKFLLYSVILFLQLSTMNENL
jgi:hypothetical protein